LEKLCTSRRDFKINTAAEIKSGWPPGPERKNRSSPGLLPWAELVGHLAVGEHHIRLALQSLEIMFGKSVALFRGDQQQPGLMHKSVNPRRRERFLLFQRLIHGDDDLGQRLEPGEPGVGGQQLKKVVRGLDGAHGFLITDALRIHQRLVQAEQGIAEFLQLAPDIGFHLSGNDSLLRAKRQSEENEMVRWLRLWNWQFEPDRDPGSRLAAKVIPNISIGNQWRMPARKERTGQAWQLAPFVGENELEAVAGLFALLILANDHQAEKGAGGSRCRVSAGFWNETSLHLRPD